jgi:hypothetical protein
MIQCCVRIGDQPKGERLNEKRHHLIKGKEVDVKLDDDQKSVDQDFETDKGSSFSNPELEDDAEILFKKVTKAN